MRARRLERIVLLCGAALVLARSAAAFELEGTADFEVSDEPSEMDPFTVVTLAGFELVGARDGSGPHLRLFAEYGPAQILERGAQSAGQLLIEAPLVRFASGRSVRLEATDFDIDVVYEAWRAGGATIFEGTATDGWVDLRYEQSGDQLVVVDAVFSVLVADSERAEGRLLEGVMFGGDVAPRPGGPTRPGPRPQVRRVDSGCSGSTIVVIEDDPYDDPYYDDGSAGCGDDAYAEPDPYASDESGCAGDEYDDGAGDPAYDSTDSGCAGDESDSASSSSDDSGSSCDQSCQGDDTERAKTAVGWVIRPIARDRRPVEWLTRHIHLTLPLVFWAFARRRERERGRPTGSRYGV